MLLRRTALVAMNGVGVGAGGRKGRAVTVVSLQLSSSASGGVGRSGLAGAWLPDGVRRERLSHAQQQRRT
ncbi:hypothetical protein BST61_g6366 [Cercospora zeina]